MAAFTQDIKVQAGPATSFLNLAKGTDAPKPDTATGTALKGIGDLLSQTVGVVDQANKTAIDRELYAAVDEQRDEQGVGVVASNPNVLIPQDATTVDNAKTQPLPPSIGATEASVARLTAAYKDGKISDTYYWAQVESKVRSIRARYPGYREEIDKKVSSITGTTPANALRRSLLEDLNSKKSAAQTAEEKWQAAVEKDKEWMTPEQYLRAKQSKDPSERLTIQSEVQQRQSTDKKYASLQAALSAKKAQNQDVRDEAYSQVTTRANDFVLSTINGGLAAAKDLEKLLEGGAGKVRTPEEQQQIRATFNALKLQVTTGLQKIYTNKFGDGSNNSYAGLIAEPGKLEALTKQAMVPLEAMEKSLTDGDFGTFNMDKNLIQGIENANVRALLENVPEFQALQAARKIMGDQLPTWLNSVEGAATLNNAAKAMNQIVLMKIGNGSIKSGIEGLRELQRAGIKDPAAYKANIQQSINALKDPKAPDAVLNTVGTAYFGEANKNFATEFKTEKQQRQVFGQLTSPEITKNLSDRKGTNPDVWNSYKTWAGTTFNALNRQTVADIKELGSRSDIGIKFIPREDGTITFEQPPLSGTQGQVTSLGVWENNRRRAQELVDKFNSGVQSLSPIIKADGGKITQELDSFYKNMGIGSVPLVKPSGDKRSEAPAPEGMVQLAAYSPDEQQGTFAYRDTAIDLEGETRQLIDLDGKGFVSSNYGRFSPILDVIGKAEAPKGYNQIFGDNREAPLENMTILEVYDLQRSMLRSGSESTAVGRYQFLRDTLMETVNRLGLDPKTVKFTPEVQDQLAVALVGKSLKAYQEGKIDADTLADRLADKWAGLPLANGQSKYKGVGSNNATISRRAVLAAIADLKQD